PPPDPHHPTTTTPWDRPVTRNTLTTTHNTPSADQGPVAGRGRTVRHHHHPITSPPSMPTAAA
ncbi:hypothetical protein ACIGJO_34225, partial [Streptomyces sp. NPDC079020]|uniref:hypothetical protein n=1 Tax=Streptomyces sp. NPDC079020 TaxID=3365722 RepID=UPI0037D3552A